MTYEIIKIRARIYLECTGVHCTPIELCVCVYPKYDIQIEMDVKREKMNEKTRLKLKGKKLCDFSSNKLSPNGLIQPDA